MVKEPKFMQELHKIRAQMAKDWKKMTSQELIKSINEAGRWLRKQISSRSKKV
jgi:predicted RNA-binding protein